MAQKCGNCQRNCMAKRIQPPAFENSFPLAITIPNGLIILVAATQPIRQGKAPGKAPTSTATELIFFNGVYIKAYRNKLNADNNAASQLNPLSSPLKNQPIIKTPA